MDVRHRVRRNPGSVPRLLRCPWSWHSTVPRVCTQVGRIPNACHHTPLLRKYQVDFALLSSSDDEVCYEVSVPFELDRDRVTNALLKLDPDGHAGVEWNEKKPKAK